MTKIYLRAPRDEIEHAPSRLHAYGTGGEGQKGIGDEGQKGTGDGKQMNSLAKFAKLWSFGKNELCYLLIVYTILLVISDIFLILKIFPNSPLSGNFYWMFVLLPHELLVNSFGFIIKLNFMVEKPEKRGVSALGVCKILVIVILWLIGWGLGALGLYLITGWFFSSLLNGILFGMLSFAINLACLLIAVFLHLAYFLLSNIPIINFFW